MGRNRKKTVRVPETLWRLFGNRARTLAETLCSLLPPLPPPSPMKCGCRDGQICLACVGNEDAMSSLLRPDDPSDYRTLLNRCFVVVSENAPPLTGFSFVNRLSQHELISLQRSCDLRGDNSSRKNFYEPRENAEDPKYAQHGNDDAIRVCNDVSVKHTQSSHVVDLLITSAWCHLLRRTQKLNLWNLFCALLVIGLCIMEKPVNQL
ncbi:hypothetical protein Syun_001687 [Stephania yunnanensis]|uniref:Telomerase reverse transcriptase n=1 Tax=Stephania yunnanensis TaxID=152371 RepID=A0AAP0LG63_9MAGN